MKNLWKLMGICALVIGVASLAGCKESDPGDGKLPAPTGLEAKEITSTTVRLVWNAVEGASHYLLTVTPEDGGDATKYQSVRPEYKVTKNLTENTTYIWEVWAVGATGEESTHAFGTFTTEEIVIPAPGGIGVQGEVGYDSVDISWVVNRGESDGYVLKLQGKFVPNLINPEYLTDLGGGRQELTLDLSSADVPEGAYAQNEVYYPFEGILIQDTDYIAKVSLRIGDKVGPSVEVSFRTRAPRPPIVSYEELLGNYTVAGTPKTDGDATWSSALAQPALDGEAIKYAYLLTNPLNLWPGVKANNPSMTDEQLEELMSVIHCKEDLYLLGDNYPIYTGSDGFSWRLMTIINNQVSYFDGKLPLTLDVATKKLSFPTTNQGQEISYAIVSVNFSSGAVQGTLTDAYTNVSMTLDGTRASISGTKTNYDFSKLKSNIVNKVSFKSMECAGQNFLLKSKYIATIDALK
jgi:hypothetical protein